MLTYDRRPAITKSLTAHTFQGVDKELRYTSYNLHLVADLILYFATTTNMTEFKDKVVLITGLLPINNISDNYIKYNKPSAILSSQQSNCLNIGKKNLDTFL